MKAPPSVITSVLFHVFLRVYYCVLQAVHTAGICRNKGHQAFLAEDVSTLEVDSTSENLLHLKVFQFFSIYYYHPAVHLS